MQEQQNRCYSVAVIMTRCAYTHKFVFGLFWCTKECLTRKCRAFFCCSILRRHDLVQRRRYSNRAAARKCRKERHSAAFLSPRALYFLRTVCYGITVHGLPTIFKAIPHNSKCRYGERGAADAKPKAQIILDVLSSILATQMPCRSRRSGA